MFNNTNLKNKDHWSKPSKTRIVENSTNFEIIWYDIINYTVAIYNVDVC